ncbi:MAG TPA: iron-containing alcohol dehydrogenase [Reyranella sp.]|nr:iron-containing alcohol dehydrogenase [Reyranella sp.]
MWRYRNPVDVKFGLGAFERLGEGLRARAHRLVTYDDANGGGIFAELTERVVTLAGEPAAMVCDIGPNPDFIGLEQSGRLHATARRPIEAMVALGGGSVIDATKVRAAANGDGVTLPVDGGASVGRG